MRYALLCVLALLVAACQSQPDVVPEETVEEASSGAITATTPGYTAFGASISADDAVPVDSVVTRPEAYVGQTVKLEGTVAAVCQMKGCWFTLQAPGGRNVRLMVPRDDGDYAFTMPKDISGRTVIVEGMLTEEALSEDTQRHLAEDAGEPIEDTVAPATELQMIPRGVLLKRS